MAFGKKKNQKQAQNIEGIHRLKIPFAGTE